MTTDARPTADDLLNYARKLHELAVLLKFDKDFESRFSAAVEAGDERELSGLLAPLGFEGTSIADKVVERGKCEHCVLWQGKWVCHPLCW
ncbi:MULTISPECIES: hypothetical protein [unclassified Nonomuraea]|uniref:hypothetical protein n=1 Tax=unclassified Nonomuraea TaxID=2593643 RepID=UPI0034369635